MNKTSLEKDFGRKSSLDLFFHLYREKCVIMEKIISCWEENEDAKYMVYLFYVVYHSIFYLSTNEKKTEICGKQTFYQKKNAEQECR